MVHEIHLERLGILKAELEKDLSPEERMRVFDDIRDVNLNSLLKDTENKRFISALFEKAMAAAGVTAVAVMAVVVAVRRAEIDR